MTGYRLSTDRVDGTIVAECPNKDHPDDGHLAVDVEYQDAVNNDLLDVFREAFPECGECGAPIDFLGHEEPAEVLD